MKAIWKREIQGYFCTAAGYVYLCVFLTVSSVLFYLEILSQRSGELPSFIGEMSYLWMLLSPVLTMRLLAEEKQKKTDQLLLTSPVSLPRIVLGKYLAAVTVLLLATGLTLLYVGIVAAYGRVYPAELAVNYLGFVLQGCAFVALDLFLSGCAETPVTAAVLAFGANFLLWILDLLENAIHVEWIASVLRFCSLYARNEAFLMGQLSFAGILFDLTVIALFLCLTVFRMERKRSGGKLRLSLRRKAGPVRTGKTHGRWPAVLMILLAASAVALNIGAERLEKRYGLRRDYSFNSISTHSEVTRDTLEHLEHPVHLYALFRKGNEDAPLLELLDRYAAATGLVTWEQADPALNPALISRFSTDTSTPGEDSLIVFCEETGRWRTLGPEDYVSVSMDAETGEYSYSGLTYERSITNAISWVTRETVPKVVIVQGHGELDGNTVQHFDGLLTANRFEVTYVDLADPDYIPDPEDLLVFFSPQKDLNEEEIAKVKEFAALGGSFLFTCDYTDPVEKMPGYAALLRSGNTSYLKQVTGGSTSLEKSEGDADGPFALALQARRVTDSGYLSRACIIGCSGALVNEQVYAMTDIQPFIVRMAEFLLDLEPGYTGEGSNPAGARYRKHRARRGAAGGAARRGAAGGAACAGQTPALQRRQRSQRETEEKVSAER